jgi:hypothetical protein
MWASKPRIVLVVAALVSGLVAVFGLLGSSQSGSAATSIPGLRVSATISPTSLTTSGTIRAQLKLANFGLLPRSLRSTTCSSFEPRVLDGFGRVVWSQGFECDLTTASSLALAPGASQTEEFCLQVVRRLNASCSTIGTLLWPGTYRLGGLFYGQEIPPLAFRITGDDLFAAQGKPVSEVTAQSAGLLGLMTTVKVKNFRPGSSDLYLVQVDLRNPDVVAKRLTVQTCEPPLSLLVNAPVTKGGRVDYGLWRYRYPQACPATFRPGTVVLGAGQDVTVSMCFQYWHRPEPTSWLCSRLETEDYTLSGSLLGQPIPELQFQVSS